MNYEENIVIMILKEFSDWQKEGLGYKKISQDDSRDEQIIKGIYNALKYLELENSWDILCDEPYVDILDAYDWLEKQGEQKPNPYSGTSFEYNGHIWGICARDNGVDILLDKQLFKHLDTQGENKPNFSDIRVWKYIVDMVLTEQNGIGQYLDNPDTERIAKKIQEKYGNIEKKELKKIDKIEPKPKVGDWITDGYVGGQITSIDDNYPCYKIADFMGGINTSIPFSLQDNYHLWTINDAKDGDVLVTEDYIFIFKYILYGGVHLYCHYNFDDEEFDSDIPAAVIGNIHDKGIHFRPAAKEQRDLLFKKMQEAGYEWRQEEKKLIKINEPKQ